MKESFEINDHNNLSTITQRINIKKIHEYVHGLFYFSSVYSVTSYSLFIMEDVAPLD